MPVSISRLAACPPLSRTMRFASLAVARNVIGLALAVGIVLTVSTCLRAVEPPAAITAEQEKLFETRIRPLLAANCLECHGAKKQESGLRLDSRAALIEGGDSGERAVVPGDPERSLLI